MAVPKLTEKSLAALSNIKVQYFLGPSTRKAYLEILIIRYSGKYRFGSGGNGDAQFMYAMAKTGVAAFEPWGVIHDLSELAYEWGDMLDMVFAVGPIEPREYGTAVIDELFRENRAMTPAILVGPQCAEAVRTLLLGINSSEPLEKVGKVFSIFEDAWDFVDAQID
jgi:hypothetical protein